MKYDTKIEDIILHWLTMRIFGYQLFFFFEFWLLLVDLAKIICEL